MDYLNHIIEGNWKKMKGKAQEQWSKLTDDDIGEINGSYLTLKGKLQELYGYKSAEVEKELIEFIYSNRFDELKHSTIDKIQEIKQSIVSTLDQYFGSAKQKSIDIEKSLADCMAKNPLKCAGVAAAIGITIGLIIKK